MLITIIGGTGSVGSYFAMNLVNAGNKVSIIGRHGSESLHRLINSGLTVKTSKGYNFIPNSAFEYIGEFDESAITTKQELLIVVLKYPNINTSIASQIKHLTNEQSSIGIISNGLPFYFLQGLNLPGKNYIYAVDPEGEINQLLESRQIVAILPALGAHIESPGVAVVTTLIEKIKVEIGPLKPLNDISIISQVFKEAGMDVIVNQDNIHKAILEKLQFALSINIISALIDQSNGYVFEAKETQGYIGYAIKFVNQLSLNLGIGQLQDYEKFKTKTISKLHFSSMHKDIAEGKIPEINVIISAPLELAEYFEENKTTGNAIHISPKPLEIVQELLLNKSKNILVSQDQINHLYEEANYYYNKFLVSESEVIGSTI